MMTGASRLIETCRRDYGRRNASRAAMNPRPPAVYSPTAREYGALRYREFRGDELGDSLRVGDGDRLTAAVVDFKLLADREQVTAFRRAGRRP
jgi:hypothetical protein